MTLGRRSLLLVLAAAACCASATVDRLDRWTVAPASPTGACECPGVRGALSPLSADCLCLNGTYTVAMPNTLLGALLPYIPFDPLFGTNLNRISPTPFFRREWWLNTTFEHRGAPGDYAELVLEGVNYRATVFVNDVFIAGGSDVVGPFRRFAFDITNSVQATGNTLSLLLVPSVDHTFPPNSNSTDLSITWVDWNPEPPDRSMGILQPIEVHWLKIPVVVAGFTVNTTLSPDRTTFSAMLSVALDFGRSTPSVLLRVNVSLSNGTNFTMLGESAASFDSQRLFFRPVDYPSLGLFDASLLWNPWQLGKPTQHRITIEAVANGTQELLTDSRIAFREVTSHINEFGARQFVINGKPLQIRGGGWAPDLFLRSNDTLLKQQLVLVRHMNLNTIRLEGKFMWAGFFDATDEFGLLVLPGFCCCDSWQHWGAWGTDQYVIARESLRTQLQILARHPSVVGFLYSSDQLPPVAVEEMYLRVFVDEVWPTPAISSASATPSPITGPSGVKMSGPYAWVPPVYWLQDANQSFADLGGAWGFLTEGGPGGSPMTLHSWRRTVPPADLWTEGGLISPAFSYHCANPMGRFGTLRFFTAALDARYGPSATVRGALYRSQASTYEAIRAMFEAYARQKHAGATGVIQWMMNNAWPSNMWHLFDYYLGVGGGFYGARQAGAPLALTLSYADWTIALVNNAFAVRNYAAAPLTVRAAVRDLRGALLWNASVNVTEAVGEDAVMMLPSLTVPWAAIGVPAGSLALVRLEWSDSQGEFTNDYWVGGTMDVVNWTDSTWYRTGVSQYANLTALNTLPCVNVTFTLSHKRPADGGGWVFEGHLSNPSSAIAAFVSISAVSKMTGLEVTPTLFERNYVNLLPQETVFVAGWLSHGDTEDVVFEVEAYNNAV
jgi:exo-1,4-beta-D-glucosaminidase